MEREFEDDGERRVALGVLPADDPRGSWAGTSRLLHVDSDLIGGKGNMPEDVGIKVSKTLFAPRLGFAYRINDKTVFRSGYGMTYDPIP